MKHVHAEFIKAWADGQEVQVMTNSGWANVARSPSWIDTNQYRIKLEPAATKWPQTTMTSAGLSIAYVEKVSDDALRDVANAAIAHACEAGQLVPSDKVRDIEAKARAEGVKQGMIKQQQASQEAEFYRSQMPTVTYSLFDLWGRK